jgi:hypothetical protein
MATLETQIGQVHFDNKKLSKSFVWLYSEKITQTSAEIYFIFEIPILNHNVWPEYEKIAQELQHVLKKNYSTVNPSAFENALAQMNQRLEEYSKGKGNFIGKINSCVAVREGDQLFVATAGKVHSYLLRDGKLTDIADTDTKAQKAKTFTNFAVGKIKKKDFLIFSTTEIFNHISIERFRGMLLDTSLTKACHNIAETIRELQDSTISFGTLIVELGNSSDFIQANIESFVDKPERNYGRRAAEIAAGAMHVSKQLYSYGKSIRLPEKLEVPSMPKIPTMPLNLKDYASLEKFRSLSRAKRFFLVSSLVFLLLLLINIAVASKSSDKKSEVDAVRKQYEELANNIVNTNTFLILNDQSQALATIAQARQKLDSLPVMKELKDERSDLEAQILELERNIGKLEEAEVSEIAKLENKNPDQILLVDSQLFVIDSVAKTITPVNPNGGTIGSETKLSVEVKDSSADENGLIFSDTNNNLYTLENGESQPEPNPNRLPENSVGLVAFGSPRRAYTINKDNDQITYAVLGGNQSLVSYLKTPVQLDNALDLAIDGAVYILSRTEITKYLSGQSQPFINNGFQFPDNSKIYSDTSFVYIIEPVIKRIIIFDKNGALVTQLSSSSFNDLRDMALGGDGNLYVLNGNNVLKVTNPN